jgi:hypothetical protein
MLSPKAMNLVAPRAWGGVGIMAVGTDGVSCDAVPMTRADGPEGDGDVGVAVVHAAAVNEHPSHIRSARLDAYGLPAAAHRAKPIRPF